MTQTNHPLCANCPAACCRGWDVSLTAEDAARIPAHLHDGKMMRQTPDGACAALENNGCSIYADRPEVCRLFRPGSRSCAEVRSKIE